MNILDRNFNIINTIDLYESALWNIRFCSPGDFRVKLSPYTANTSNALIQYYVTRDDTDRVMIIKKREPDMDADGDDTITISGVSLESILYSRIIWDQTIISGNLQNGIQTLINENAIQPYNTNRIIPGLIFEESIDPNVTDISIPDTQFTGDNLGETISNLCGQYGIGWKITLNENHQMVFKLIAGKKKIPGHDDYTQVTFSTENDNLLYSRHSIDMTNYKNTTLIAGEGEGINRRTAVYGDEASGLDRYEVYTDARDITSSTPNGSIPDYQYTDMLIERGKQNLANYSIEEMIDAQVETNETTMFEFKDEELYNSKSDFPSIGRPEKVYVDMSNNSTWAWYNNIYYPYHKGYYSLGDIVNVIDRFGYEATLKVTEVTICEDEGGIETHPIFESYQESEEQND